MKKDTGVRSLELLHKHGSTSRVLNLIRAAENHSEDPEFIAKPFFKNARLNRSFILKHHVRSDEAYLMIRRQKISTKIIFPLIGDMLSIGGQSVIIGQKNFKQIICEACGETEAELSDDLRILGILDKLPSLDPFLLREYLRKNDIEPANCYFDISPADVIKMKSFAASEVSKLIGVAFGTGGDSPVELVDKMVELILSNETNEKLQPLRMALGLRPEEFTEGVFAWRGFLYFKWQLSEAFEGLQKVIRETDKVNLTQTKDKQMMMNIGSLSAQLKQALKRVATDCREIIALYDKAFDDLIERAHAAAFRKFLLDSPTLFLELGHLMGSIVHITSFWGYKFRDNAKLTLEAEEYEELLTEFITGLMGESAQLDRTA